MASRSAITLAKKSPTDILQLRCHVRPGASKVREGITSVTDEMIELCVAAQAQDGKANKAVAQVLSEVLGIAKSGIQITHGLKSRDKTVCISSNCFRGTGKDVDILALVKEKLLVSKDS
ncbi:hypothetical protein F4780DRAFT_756795 [Xylariomycetidae sp. FL0641]|nr:hypothetical protein F4780DRAFT_756795 [Xylariomycetidae sp. FL0641]